MKSAEKCENFGEKLRKGVFLMRRGQRTPVIRHSWRLTCASEDGAHDSGSPVLISARKLAASLWELHNRLPSAKMHRGDTRRIRHVAASGPVPSSPDLPDSASGLRRHFIASLMQHHRSAERNNHHALQPVYPASDDTSSMEVVHYNAAVTPSSSIDFRETNHGLKTSTELIKVLNRIWSLEEQHSSNMSVVKALKKELDNSRMRIKELVRERKNDKYEIEDLKIQVLENRKNKEHEKNSSVVQSIKDELEDEKKMRKRSENLHRKLARELYEVKISLSNASKEAERESSSRRLLEDLCDEFARGIKDYEQEIHKLKQKHEKDLVGKSISRDRLILHLSESWLDERMQMKLGEKPKTSSVVEKMGSEIESFLLAKREDSFVGKGNMVQKRPNFRRSSLESIPLNTVISAPQHVGDDEDSDVSDSYCFELNKPSSIGIKPNEENQNIDGLNIERAKNDNDSNINIEKGKSEICEIVEEQGDEERENGIIDRGESVSKTNHIMDELIRSQYHHGSNFNESSQWGRNASPVRQWTPKLPSKDKDISESSNTKLPLDLRENTLKAKLIEARTRGQRSRSRLKGSKFSF